MITVRAVKTSSSAAERRKVLLPAAFRLAADRAEAVAVRARFYAPRDSGNLRARIEATKPVQVATSRVEARVEADTFYAVWQHEGTGIYGPHRQRIVPVRAPYLRFYWKKVGAVVFFKSVRGTPGTKYLIKAVRDVCREKFWDIEYFTTF